MSDNLRIGEVARRLEVSSATIRNYTTAFGDYLSPTAKRKTGKRYTPNDLVILRSVKLHLDDGLTYADIPERLSYIPEIIDDIDDGQDDSNAYESPFEQPGQDNAIAPLEFFTNVIEQQQQQHQREVAAKDETISILKDDIERLRQELTQERRSWWRKLFNS